jgi:hypothetical protein
VIFLANDSPRLDGNSLGGGAGGGEEGAGRVGGGHPVKEAHGAHGVGGRGKGGGRGVRSLLLGPVLKVSSHMIINIFILTFVIVLWIRQNIMLDLQYISQICFYPTNLKRQLITEYKNVNLKIYHGSVLSIHKITVK